MERLNRTAFQGIANILRFNWHYYALSLAILSVLIMTRHFLPPTLNGMVRWVTLLISLIMIASLTVSYFIYDYSNFYTLNWLNNKNIRPNGHMLNINAGFDETSRILKDKFPGGTLTVLDFYDPAKHTEVSIERARKAYPKYPGTKGIDTADIAIPANSVDSIFLIFAAHEIRNDRERVEFFRQLGQSLSPGGQIVVVEHLRDGYNFLAYNIGCLHFLSKGTWKRTFREAGLSKPEEIKINLFVSIFLIKNNGVIA